MVAMHLGHNLGFNYVYLTQNKKKNYSNLEDSVGLEYDAVSQCNQTLMSRRNIMLSSS